MELHRRRTDHLPNPATLPSDPLARARAACDALAECGIDVAFGLQLADTGPGMLCATAGHVGDLLEVGRGLARQAVVHGRALRMAESEESRLPRRWHLAAMPCGSIGDDQVVLVVADPTLSQREAQAMAAWVAPAGANNEGAGGPCAPLARGLAADYDCDVVLVALFAQSGMLVNLHTRSGGLLRSWRAPIDTVWGEAARHHAAYVLGDLHMHPGAESLASLGMQAAAVIGIENGSGVAVGAIAVASTRQLDMDIAQRLLERAPVLGPQVMSLRSRSAVPTPDASGAVALRGFAARVGCRRFAMYAREGSALRLVSAHAEDGTVLASPPDPYEEQLVCWAAEKGVAVASDDAAAVVVGGDTILYAHDPGKRPIERLRLALQDLRHSPFDAADGDDGRAAA
jgi:hypothetical protein